jgi:predicted flavoprotein YhiN
MCSSQTVHCKEIGMSKERLIVIGGNAAGMSAASQAGRQRPELEVIAFEQSPHTSYSA